LIDEAQGLLDQQVNDGNFQVSMFHVAMVCTVPLRCSCIWSGTRMGISIATSEHSGIAKLYTGKELGVLGRYHYITSDEAERYLTTILDLSLDDQDSQLLLKTLSYSLQGRARMLTGFIGHLLTPTWGIYENPAFTNNGALSASVLKHCFDDYLTRHVHHKIEEELLRLHCEKLLTYQDIGLLWCFSMIYNTDVSKQPECMQRKTSLLFTRSVDYAEETYKAEEDGLEVTKTRTSYRFDYVYGEPMIQQALLRFVRNNPFVADLGITEMLRSVELCGPAHGEYHDFAVALTLLTNRSKGLVSNLIAGHSNTRFRDFEGYCLEIDHIVRTRTATQQLEWFTKITANPNDDTFSLLPGVPVRTIAILPNVLSGADVICGATLPEDVVDHGASSSTLTTGGKRKRELPPLLFLQFCCATYDGTEHQEQALEYKPFMKVLKDHGQIDYLLVLVEMPQNDTTDEDANFVLVKQIRKGNLLFCDELMNVLTRKESITK
jgi:hypothetical protein